MSLRWLKRLISRLSSVPRCPRPTSARRPSCRPALEGLEDRCVPTTTASLSGGTLWINGDNGNQMLTITQKSSTSYQVSAPDLKGGSPQTFQGVQGSSIFTGNGNDSVMLKGNGQPGLQYGVEFVGSGALNLADNNFNIWGTLFRHFWK